MMISLYDSMARPVHYGGLDGDISTGPSKTNNSRSNNNGSSTTTNNDDDDDDNNSSGIKKN